MKVTGVRILLATCDSSVAARLGNALEIAGFEVLAVARASEVLRVVARSAPDVLICSTDLPDADAVQLARRLRRQAVPFPVVLIADDPYEPEHSFTDRSVASSTLGSFFAVPCDEQRIVDLVTELILDMRTTGPNVSGFPTRVIWPTARRRAALVAR